MLADNESLVLSFGSSFETPFFKYNLHAHFPNFQKARGSFAEDGALVVPTVLGQVSESADISFFLSSPILSMKYNQNVDLPAQKRLVYCELCQKGFTSNAHVQRHFRTVHYNLKPYKCKYCRKSFGRSDNMKNHEKTHTWRDSIS